MAYEDPLRKTFTDLRTVAVVGPRLAADDPRPLWRVFAGAPKFGHTNARDEHGQKNGLTADNVHSLRLLAADTPDKDNWRNPRLIDLHLSIGSRDTNYASESETLEIAANPARTPIKGQRGALFYANADHDAGPEARFIRVVCEPLPDGDNLENPAIWPRDNDPDVYIQVPTMRLVAGAIALRIKLFDKNGDKTDCTWLHNNFGLLITKPKPSEGKEKWGELSLTPDGVEFDAALHFPGAQKKLEGRVLLKSVSTGGRPAFAVTLLPSKKPKEGEAWLKAWRKITPVGPAEKDLTGFVFKANRGVVPAFRWRLDKLPDSKEIEVPVDAMLLALLPPAGPTGVEGGDGSAHLLIETITVRENPKNIVEFKGIAGIIAGDSVTVACHPGHDDSADVLSLTVSLTKGSSAALEVDDDKLAADLRRAYGLANPQLVAEPGKSAITYLDPPLLSAFTPLKDGWLQFHLPNLPLIDTSNDASLAPPPPAAKRKNILAGYFRLRGGRASTKTMSAYKHDIEPLLTLPLELTIARAAGVKVIVSVDVSVDAAKIVEATAELFEADLETRGLLFVSSARPDALEALPRLAAGPGLVIPLTMHGTRAPVANSILGVELQELSATASRLGDVTLKNARMALTFDAGRERWREISKEMKNFEGFNKARQIVLGEVPEKDQDKKLDDARDKYLDVEKAEIAVEDANSVLDRAKERRDRFQEQKKDIEKQLTKFPPHRDQIEEKVFDELARALLLAEKKHSEAEEERQKAMAALKAANNRSNEANLAFTQEMRTLLAKVGPPLPAVAWLRHPTTPLAAAMPMTRAACGAVQPMETRALIPLRLVSASLKNPLRFELAIVDRSSSEPLPRLVDGVRARVEGWPWASGNYEDRPERGVPFAAVGVPGLEARPAAGETTKPTWELAYRYDLPTLDEAFATASLPPSKDTGNGRAKPSPDEKTATSEEKIPTALDWASLGAFWREQERKLQNARVSGSYLIPFVKNTFNGDIKNLIEGVKWPLTVTMQLGAETDALPFGVATITQLNTQKYKDDLRSNTALKGIARDYEVKGDTLVPKSGVVGAEKIVSVLGFAPSTYLDGGIHLDNRRSGAAAPKRGDVHLREVHLAGAKALLASLAKPLEVSLTAIGNATSAVDISKTFLFWFKDVLLDPNDGEWCFDTTKKGDALDFDVWGDVRRLAAAGFEWRFFDKDFKCSLVKGRDLVPFFGFDLEPLRLLVLELDKAQSFKSAKILCRLDLGPADDAPDCGINLVELSLFKADGKLTAQFEASGNKPLRYTLDCKDGLACRRAIVKMELLAGAGLFKPSLTSLQLRVAGKWIEFGNNETIELGVATGDSPATVKITYPADARRLKFETHSFAVLQFEILVNSSSARIKLQRMIEIAPPDNVGASVLEIREPYGDTRSVKIFGVAVAIEKGNLTIDEGDGAFVLTLSNPGTLKIGEATFNAGLALAARVDETSDNGTLGLAAFHAMVDLKQLNADKAETIMPSVTLKDGRALIFSTLEQRQADGNVLPRANMVTFSGIVTAASSILWPSVVALDAAKDGTIPFPIGVNGRDGRVRVKGSGEPVRHQATWIFSNHRAPIKTVAALAAGDPNTILSTFVMTRHKLWRGTGKTEKRLKWTSVETVAIGAPKALVPPLVLDDFAKQDSTTFAPRYKHVLLKGEYKHVDAAGMRRPGRGAVATVLQGALGAAFRASFASDKRQEKLIIAGGFLGIVSPDGSDNPRPLLRLPILAGVEMQGGLPPIRQEWIANRELEIAWADGPAARLVTMTRPTGPRPASAQMDAIAAAVAVGSDALWHSLDIDADDPVGALLVEQSFPAEEFPAETNIKTEADLPLFGPLHEAPFFISSAVAVTRVLDDSNAHDPQKPSIALALSAGYAVNGKRKRPLAAALSLADDDRQPTAPRDKEHGRLIVVGTKVAFADWSEPNDPIGAERAEKNGEIDAQKAAENGEIIGATVARMAATLDTDPVAALVVLPPLEGRAPTSFVPWVARANGFQRVTWLDPGKAQFPDIGRGRMHPPSANDNESPLFFAPPLEGPARPIRDDELSGVAGLARRIAMPMQAGKAGTAEAPPRPIWLSQSRVPVYLPLAIAGMSGPPISWLAPASSKTRLPTDSAMRDVLFSEPDSKYAAAQPFLPAMVDAAEVGERPGVVTVRRARLLGAAEIKIDDKDVLLDAFDPGFARFGQPAQSSSSFARTLRTPRPGPLPANQEETSQDGKPLENADRNRRIQASPLRPTQPIDAFLGSADVLAGDYSDGRWSVVVVAMPDSRSIFSDRWDGTVKLRCHLEITYNKDTPITETPAQMLARLLLPETGPSAFLKIDETVLLMDKLEWDEEPKDWDEESKSAQDGGEKYIRKKAIIDLILKPNDNAAVSAEHKIRDALRDVLVPPPTLLQWTVFPSGSRTKFASSSLTLSTSTAPLAVGEELPPISLRFPLYPVAESCGALPLMPATIVFGDPAYDRDLSGLPFSDERLLAQGAGSGNGAPTDRGRLRLSFFADRWQVNRSDSVTLMLDLRYEKPLPDKAQIAADLRGSCHGGDLTGDNQQASATLSFKLQTHDGQVRDLLLGDTAPTLPAGKIGQFALAALTEANKTTEINKTPASLVPGDIIVISAALPEKAQFHIWDPEKSQPSELMLLKAEQCVLRLAVTAESTTPPPPALYVGLLRTQEQGSVATALHAQSPMPWRVDLVDPLRGFRRGLLRRRAQFVWTLMRPEKEFGPHRSLAVVKQDRNGQTWLPENEDVFTQPQ
jgi:hypothetical protein